MSLPEAPIVHGIISVASTIIGGSVNVSNNTFHAVNTVLDVTSTNPTTNATAKSAIDTLVTPSSSLFHVQLVGLQIPGGNGPVKRGDAVRNEVNGDAQGLWLAGAVAVVAEHTIHHSIDLHPNGERHAARTVALAAEEAHLFLVHQVLAQEGGLNERVGATPGVLLILRFDTDRHGLVNKCHIFSNKCICNKF